MQTSLFRSTLDTAQGIYIDEHVDAGQTNLFFVSTPLAAMPRTKRLHALKRPQLRQDWSKWNLYNLSRAVVPGAANKTFFQQKWLAKRLLRSYHNPDVREGTWTRMFDRRLPAVVPMDHRYLAKFDGSEMSAGRGSGAEQLPEPTRRTARGAPPGQDKTPYMHMTFHPLEKRLDTAIFRALFASSTRQARQLVVHGFVKVNGKKMIYPGYQLNPGDMFQVDPEMVMFSTGARKLKKDSPRSNQDLRKSAEAREARQEQKEREEEDRAIGVIAQAGDSEAGSASLEVASTETAAGGQIDPSQVLKRLRERAQLILDDSKRELSGKRQQELRGFRRAVRDAFAKMRGKEQSEIQETTEGFEEALAEILSKVPQDAAVSEASKLAPQPSSTLPSQTYTSPGEGGSLNPQLQDESKVDQYRARKDAELLHAALERARANPVDSKKPYATPWQPRDFMSAFAFIPRYLEVNQNVCSAVYLRHPVARPGLAEVPTPFAAETMGLGFNWYLRRR